jgi:hypothetical protein
MPATATTCYFHDIPQSVVPLKKKTDEEDEHLLWFCGNKIGESLHSWEINLHRSCSRYSTYPVSVHCYCKYLLFLLIFLNYPLVVIAYLIRLLRFPLSSEIKAASTQWISSCPDRWLRDPHRGFSVRLALLDVRFHHSPPFPCHGLAF